jgi:hypothetical protein
MNYNKGVFPASIRFWLNERFGEEGVSRVSANLSQEARKMFDNPESKEWYPEYLVKELYEVIDKEFGNTHPDAFKDYGSFNAERDAGGFLRYLMRFITMQVLLKRLGAFWKQYNRGAKIEMGPISTARGKKEVVLSVQDYDLGAKGCIVLEEYFKVLCGKTGAQDVQVVKNSCIHKGDDCCSWKLSWKD